MKWFQKKTNLPIFDPPGPSPWYLHGKTVETSAGVFRWNNFENDHEFAGLSFLTSPSGKEVLILDFYCYVQHLVEERILLWHEQLPEVDSLITNPFVQFEILELGKLTEIKEGDAAAQKLREEKKKVKYTGGLTAQFVYYTSVEPGEHRLEQLPAEFTELDEVLVLADYANEGKGFSYQDQICKAIFAFDFKTATVVVIPQDWFNNGGYDFGYQWITRVERDPRTRHILGEGIRLGFFRLDETGRNIEEWLVSNPFYGPRR